MDIEKIKTRLLALKADTEATLKTAQASTQTVELDQNAVGRVSRIDAIQQQEMALAGQRRRKDLLLKIDATLKRIEDGDYGYCIICEEPISEKRLELDPTVLTCIACADKK